MLFVVNIRNHSANCKYQHISRMLFAVNIRTHSTNCKYQHISQNYQDLSVPTVIISTNRKYGSVIIRTYQ